MIQQGFVTPWTIFTPTAYRLLPRKYVEAFFADGELRLSSFRAFAKHEDEERGDTGEGENVIVGRGPNSTIYAKTVHGSDAFVLCASAAPPADDLVGRFGCDAAIQIFDTTGFAAAIARHVPGIRQGFEGYCYYTDGAIEYKIADVDLEYFRLNQGSPELDLLKMGGYLQNMAGNAVFFRKRSMFRHQLEYRWIWLTAAAQDELIVRVPDARAFCLPWFVDSSPLREAHG